MKHKFYECPPSGCEDLGSSSGHCKFCDGGLGLCTVCNCAEGSLPKECPGSKVDELTQDRIMDGVVDYVDGLWRKKIVSP